MSANESEVKDGDRVGDVAATVSREGRSGRAVEQRGKPEESKRDGSAEKENARRVAGGPAGPKEDSFGGEAKDDASYSIGSGHFLTGEEGSSSSFADGSRASEDSGNAPDSDETWI